MCQALVYALHILHHVTLTTTLREEHYLPLYQWGDWNTDKVSNLPKVTHPEFKPRPSGPKSVLLHSGIDVVVCWNSHWCLRMFEKCSNYWRRHTGAKRASQSPSVMVNFMCQLGWAKMDRYLVKHYSGCFCEDIFEWDLHLNSRLYVKQITRHNKGGPHPISWRLRENKRLTSHSKRKLSSRRPSDFICNTGSSLVTLQILDYPASITAWATYLNK